MVFTEDGKVMINIIYEDNHLLVVEKPNNILVQEDNTKDKSLLTILKEYLKDKYKKPGNVYLGLVHRLDRVVGGVMVFAKTSKAAGRLSKEVRNHTFKKVYYAVLCGTLKGTGKLQNKIAKDSKTFTSYISSKGKDAILNYEVIANKDNLSLVKINLETGRHHQIRLQFKTLGFPLYGDHRYNQNTKDIEELALFAKSVTLVHPTTKEVMTFSLDLPDRYPFNIF